jgi:hypothetical protein
VSRARPVCKLLTLAAVLLLARATPANAARWTWSGSGVVDFKQIYRAPDASTLGKHGAIVEWAIKPNVEVSDKVSMTARVCTSCHGITIDQAYVELRLRREVNLQAGRINVPFGDYYQRHDPASDALLSKPLPFEMGHMLRYQATQFNLGVLPMPYVDSGALLFGDVWIGEKTQIWYGVFGANGFRSQNAQDFTFMDQVSTAGFEDNNDRLSWGGRVALARGDATLGGSWLQGQYDPAAAYDYRAWGVDGSARLRGFQLRAEYLERDTEVLDAGALRTLEKKGFYGQIETPAWKKLSAAWRIDGLLREGPSLGTDNDESSGILRWSLCASFAPALEYAFRAQYEHWRFTDFADADVVHVGLVVTY